MEFFQKGLTPPPPDFWNFWDTFSRLLELLGNFLEKCPKSPAEGKKEQQKKGCYSVLAYLRPFLVFSSNLSNF